MHFYSYYFNILILQKSFNSYWVPMAQDRRLFLIRLFLIIVAASQEKLLPISDTNQAVQQQKLARLEMSYLNSEEQKHLLNSLAVAQLD